LAANLTKKAKDLRKSSTDAERFLWKHLRTKQIDGLKFRRQEPIGKYIADFACFDKTLIIEVDGEQHSHEVDADRDAWMQSQGFKVLRFWNHDVLQNIEGVLEVIRRTCIQQSSDTPSPTPPIKGGATTL
jgi:very-short-patch-repair endonuclease